jgi:[ribosomal protein S18]-alanine N-acetyltransferase
MKIDLTVSQAKKEDISDIASFLEKAALMHRHLDWNPVLDRLGSQPFLLLKHGAEIEAILVAPPDPPQVAWIYCFGVKNTEELGSCWQQLFSSAQDIWHEQNASIYALGLEDWFCSLMVANGFQHKQDIVVLAWNHHVRQSPKLSADLFVRPMIEADLDEVAAVDAGSFEQQWVNSRESLRLAFMQSQHTSVAELNGKIIAYELTTSNQFAAHLARLAVLPEFRRSHIGQYLVCDMLHYFSSMGVLQLTVNTQSDNSASLNLYQSLGFKLTGESYPVFTF